jgi:PAS domain S-box-containing protein
VGVVPVAQILERLKREIAERERKERALSESEQRFRNMADTVPMKIIVSDTEGRATFVNKTWLTFTGRSMEEGLGDGWTSVIHPDDCDECLNTLRDSYKSRSQYQLEYRLRRSDGQYRSVLCIGRPRYEPDGTLAGYIQSLLDVTDLKQALANQKLESLGVLAGGIAHDFNNLLGAIRAQAELASWELDAGSSCREELKAIGEVAVRGSDIVRQLMIHAGKETEAPDPVDLSEIVERMLALLKVSVSKHATLKIDLEKQLPKVRANAAKMSQLMMNLVMNASEAIGDQVGTIQVTTQRVSLGPDSPGTDGLAQGEYVQLKVADTGRGMSPETVARVFEPFFSTKSAGRGLGMAVVYGIVRSLGGTIQLASELGHGTTFLILLPCAEATSGARTSPISDNREPARLAQVATILLVEDEYLLRHAASRLLHNRGFSVIEAPDGSAALDAIRGTGNPIDVLVLDVTLPGTPGCEVLKEARRLRPGMRVVVTSAYPKEMAVESLQTPIERFVRKPYRLNELVDLIQAKR